MHSNLSKRHNQKGITLIESMIALLVISVGLLGIAALQLTSMKQNSSALQNSKAVWIAYTMADRVRANQNQFANYDGVDVGAGSGKTYDRDCTASACTSGQLIVSDAQDWWGDVSILPAGRGMIDANATTMTITVMWDDEGTGATGTDCGTDPEVDLTCYRVTLTQ